MTERLYYTDAYLTGFDAVIAAIERRDDGSRGVRLDRTAFYPASGGQPFDTGTLGGVPVTEVVDADGDILHIVAADAEGLTAGGAIRGIIDWPRRFDHMQQHTGQHVLSAAIERVTGAATVSFHLGKESSTIDLTRPIGDEEIARAEGEANDAVWQNRTVAVTFVDASDAARLPLRKEPAREGMLRLVDVQGIDLSACGGTHVAATGAIGMIAIVGRERFKGGQRVEFVCGGRALRRLRAYRDIITGSVQQLSVLPHEIPRAVEKLQTEAKAHGRAIEALQIEQAGWRAATLMSTARDTAAGRLVAQTVDTSASGLKATALAVAATPGHLAVLITPSSPARVVVARARDVRLSARETIAALIAHFGGRGGGSHELAEAGGLGGDAAAILEAARRIVTG